MSVKKKYHIQARGSELGLNCPSTRATRLLYAVILRFLTSTCFVWRITFCLGNVYLRIYVKSAFFYIFFWDNNNFSHSYYSYFEFRDSAISLETNIQGIISKQFQPLYFLFVPKGQPYSASFARNLSQQRKLTVMDSARARVCVCASRLMIKGRGDGDGDADELIKYPLYYKYMYEMYYA